MHIFLPNFCTVRNNKSTIEKNHLNRSKNIMPLQTIESKSLRMGKATIRSLTTSNSIRNNYNAVLHTNSQLLDWLADLSINVKNSCTQIEQNHHHSLHKRQIKSSNNRIKRQINTPLKLERDIFQNKQKKHSNPFLLARTIQYQHQNKKNNRQQRIYDVKTINKYGTRINYKRNNLRGIQFLQNSEYRPWSPTKKQYEQPWLNLNY